MKESFKCPAIPGPIPMNLAVVVEIFKGLKLHRLPARSETVDVMIGRAEYVGRFPVFTVRPDHGIGHVTKNSVPPKPA